MDNDPSSGIALAGIAIGFGLSAIGFGTLFGGHTRIDTWRIERGMEALAEAQIRVACIEADGKWNAGWNRCDMGQK